MIGGTGLWMDTQHTNGTNDLMSASQRNTILSKDTVYFSDTDRQRIQALYGGQVENRKKELKWNPGRGNFSTWMQGKWF